MSEEIRKVRIEKAARLRERGIAPYAGRFERSHSLEDAAALEEGTADLRLAGRIVAFRDIGKLCFGHLQDFTGRLQFALQQDVLGKEVYRDWKKILDIGDFVGLEGDLFRTKTGELTLRVQTAHLLSKALRPLPEKWHGLVDQEARYRQRYLDLVMSAETRERFRTKTLLVRAMREYLDDHGFQEVETPVLAPHASGASPLRSSPGTRPSASISSSGSPPKPTSSASSSGGTRGSTSSLDASGTRVSTRRICKISRCWSTTPPTGTSGTT